MGIWGIAIWVAFGVLCYLLGRLHGAVKPKRNSWDLVVTPGYETRVMEPVEQPPPEKTLAERQFDEIIEHSQMKDW